MTAGLGDMKSTQTANDLGVGGIAEEICSEPC